MKIEVNIEKKYFFVILITMLVIGGFLVVNAYNPTFTGTSGNPSELGHSADELHVKIPSSTDPQADILTLQNAIDGARLITPQAQSGAFVSEQFICDGTNAGSIDENAGFYYCRIDNSEKFSGCFMTGYEVITGGGGFDDDCWTVRLPDGKWEIRIQQDGGEKLRCSVRCISGGQTSSANVKYITPSEYKFPTGGGSGSGGRYTQIP